MNDESSGSSNFVVEVGHYAKARPKSERALQASLPPYLSHVFTVITDVPQGAVWNVGGVAPLPLPPAVEPRPLNDDDIAEVYIQCTDKNIGFAS